MPRHPARTRVQNLVRRFVRKEPTPNQRSGLRLVRGVPLVAAIQKDRVVRDTLGRGHISLDAVRTAWYHMRNHEDGRALWRILVDVQSVDSTALFRAAAGIYGFAPAKVSMLGTAILVDSNRKQISSTAWKRMIDLGVFPIREKNDPLDYGVRWTFASFDPSRPEIRQFLSDTLSHAFQLRFVEPRMLFQLTEACFELEEAESIAWYRKYVLGRRPIALVVAPEDEKLRPAA